MAKKNKNEKITALLVVYNEEKIIKRCLDSFRDVVDEILVVHDGKCSDNTVKICKSYGTKVFIRPHVGECDPHWPFLFDKVREGWILKIDADEYLSEKLKNNLRKLTQDSNVNGYEFKWDFYNHKGKSRYDYKMALFRKSHLLKFEGIPHEYLRVSGKTIKSELELCHKPSLDPLSMKCIKVKIRWAQVHAKYLKKKNLPELIIRFLILPPFYLVYESIRRSSFGLGVLAMLYNYSLYWSAIKNTFKKN